MRLTRRQRQGDVTPFAREGTSPSNQLDRLRAQIDRLFEGPLGLLESSTSFFEGWTPRLDVYEDRDKITVQAEVPGMKKEEIELSVHGDTLTISGERKREEERKQGETFRSERYFGRFQRTVTLPQPVDVSKIDAHYRDGILTITCPKTDEARRKQIEIKTS